MNTLPPVPGARSPRDRDRMMPGGNHGLSADEVLERQRARVIDAYVQIAGTRGLTDTTIEAVCNSAGVSSRVFYRAFGNLDELFTEAFELGKSALYARATAAYASGGPSWEARVRAALESVLETLAANPALARFLVVEAVSAGPVGYFSVSRAIQEAFDLFAEVSPAGAPSDGVNDSLLSIIGGIFTSIYFRIVSGRTRELPEILEACTYFVSLPFAGAA